MDSPEEAFCLLGVYDLFNTMNMQAGTHRPDHLVSSATIQQQWNLQHFWRNNNHRTDAEDVAVDHHR